MDDATRKALQLSIYKWERIADGSGIDQGTKNCALCKKFYDNHCRGCPVRENTGKKFCDDTPYCKWARLKIEADDFKWNATTKAQFKAAEEMAAYLRSLIPNYTIPENYYGA